MEDQEPADQDTSKDDQEGAKEDHLLDDQWEDFLSLEEEEEMARQIAEAEKALMKKFERGLEEGRPARRAPVTPTSRKAPASMKTPNPKKTSASRKKKQEEEEMARPEEEKPVIINTTSKQEE